MKRREYRDYLADIAESIDDAISFVKGMTYREFVADKKTINAVVRSIEIIGEASGHVPKHIRDKAPICRGPTQALDPRTGRRGAGEKASCRDSIASRIPPESPAE